MRNDRKTSAPKQHINGRVETNELEAALRDFDRVATLIRKESTRQIWEFLFNGHPYLFYFYPRGAGMFRPARVGPAVIEFIKLQNMQRANVPSPRAVAHLSGFRIAGVLGDVLITQKLDHVIPLGDFLQQHWLSGAPIPKRAFIAVQVGTIIRDFGAAGYGHRSLTLNHFLIDPTTSKIYLHDVRGLRNGGLLVDHLFTFAHDLERHASRSDLLRGWNIINPEFYPPTNNRLAGKLRKRLIRRSRQVNDDFGIIRSGQWTGHFSRSANHAVPWSIASQREVTEKDWESAWPTILAQIESEQLTVLKRDASGEVLSGEAILAGRPIQIIVKRPKRKFWYRYIVDLFRPARAARMWAKAWMLISRNLPCEYPLLLMERKSLGYTTDAMILFERVPGQSLDQLDLDSLKPTQRDMLFRRAGRYLRRLEETGLVHYDSKSTNWIVYRDESHGAIPVMIDVDGIRPLNYFLQVWGIRRILRAMKQHPQYTPQDSLALCQGFAPRANIFQEEVEPAGKP